MRWFLAAAGLAALVALALRTPDSPQTAPRKVSVERSDSMGSPAPLPSLGGVVPSAPMSSTPRLVLPDAPQEIAAEVLAVSYDMGDGAAERYAAFVADLQTDRASAAAGLHAALAEADDLTARPILHLLGTVGHHSSMPVLADAALETLPESSWIDHHHNPRFEAANTRVMALQALQTVALRYGDPERMGTLRTTLDAVIDGDHGDAHLYASAATALRQLARDPDAMAVHIEVRLNPDFAHLAHLTQVEQLPQ